MFFFIWNIKILYFFAFLKNLQKIIYWINLGKRYYGYNLQYQKTRFITNSK